MAWKPGTPPPQTGSVSRKESNPGRFCKEKTREAQQLREPGALQSVNYNQSWGRGDRRDLLEWILHLVFIRGNSTTEIGT